MAFSSQNNRDSLLHSLFLQLRLLQQSNRFIARNPATGLTILESSFLLEIDARPNWGAKELKTLFGLNQSTISRHLSKLTRRGFLRKISNQSDSRNQIISLTDKGEKTLHKHDELSNSIIQKYKSRVSEKEMSSILLMFKKLSDGFLILPAASRKGEHPLRASMRRLTFVLGIVKTNFMNSSITSAQWQLLSEIAFREEIHSLKELADDFQTSGGNLAVLLNSLVDRNLVKKRTSKLDKRAILIEVTESGKKLLAKINETAQSEFKARTASLQTKELKNGIRALRKMTLKSDDGSLLLDEKHRVCFVKSNTQCEVARKFLIRHMASNNYDRPIGYKLIAPDSVSYSLLEGDEIKAVIEIEQIGKNGHVVNFASQSPSSPIVKSFVNKVSELYSSLNSSTLIWKN